MILRIFRQIHLDEIPSAVKQAPALVTEMREMQAFPAIIVLFRECVDRFERRLVMKRFGLVDLLGSLNLASSCKEFVSDVLSRAADAAAAAHEEGEDDSFSSRVHEAVACVAALDDGAELDVERLREMSPLWEMVQEGIDLKSIQWSGH